MNKKKLIYIYVKVLRKERKKSLSKYKRRIEGDEIYTKENQKKIYKAKQEKE